MNELDRAGLKVEIRTQYKDLGFWLSYKVLQELLVSAELWAEVLGEELIRMKKESNGKN